jgi:signal transduction histidine kinase
MGVTLIILICATGGPLAIPIVLRALRPTARAAAGIDPSELDRRLPEERVVKELLPIVRAFNAALDRLAAGFARRQRFIADVAHELRTPLAVLNMHIDSLPAGGGKLDLQRTVYRLGQMVGQMLDSERLALAARRREPVDLVETARSAVADVAPLAVALGYELGLTSACDRLIVQGDPFAISRALANLLGNAVAHGGGGGTIEVRVGRNGWVDVTDEGPGVPIEARERIFEPFRRERWDRDGCGLGLYLVREIMHAHGGEVRLVGSGSGALFRLEFAAA